MTARPTACALAGATILAACAAVPPEPDAPDVALYRLGCGEIHVSDKNLFNTDGAYPGEELDVVVSCYLVRHDDEWLLWDAGIPDVLAESGPITQGAFTPSVPTTLASQLEQLGLNPEDIDFVGLSHTHFDHVGNAPMFPNAILVLQEPEFDWVWAENGNAAARDPLAAWESGETIMALNGDTDLFGDGSVKVISLPGHTPGHQALQLELANAGTVILSGDQYHFDENRENRGVPTFNTSLEDTLRSHDKLEGRIAETDALFIIQHEPDDIGELPAFPEALD